MRRIRVLAALIAAALTVALALRAWFGIAGPPATWGSAEPPPALEVVRAERPSRSAVLLFHGCAGDFDPRHQRDWANAIAASGYDAVIVNSLRPRLIAPKTARRTVCPGFWLWGNRRAHDVAKAVSTVSPRYDRLVLVGWSHGAWSTMEYFDRFPVDPKIKSVVWFYPYCGFGATRGQKLPTGVPALVIPARDDRLVDHGQCRRDMRDIAIDEHELPGRHGFDIRDDPKVWNPDSAAQARTLVLDALAASLPSDSDR